MLKQSKLGNMINNDVSLKTIVIGCGINYEVTNEWAGNEISHKENIVEGIQVERKSGPISDSYWQ